MSFLTNCLSWLLKQFLSLAWSLLSRLVRLADHWSLESACLCLLKYGNLCHRGWLFLQFRGLFLHTNYFNKWVVSQSMFLILSCIFGFYNDICMYMHIYIHICMYLYAHTHALCIYIHMPCAHICLCTIL